MIIIIGPPPSVAYPFILDVEGYPQQIIYFFIGFVSFFVYFYVCDEGGKLMTVPVLFSLTGSFLAKMEETKRQSTFQKYVLSPDSLLPTTLTPYTVSLAATCFLLPCFCRIP